MAVEIIKFPPALSPARHRVSPVHPIKACKMETAYLINKHVKYRVNKESTSILNELDLAKILSVHPRPRNMQTLLACKI